MKPRTDLYVFIVGGRELQTDGPEKVKLIQVNASAGKTSIEQALGRISTAMLAEFSSRRHSKMIGILWHHSVH